MLEANLVNAEEISALRYVEAARAQISNVLDAGRRSELGQFMTPAPVASFMAGLFERLPDHVSLLDAGAGIGALTAAFVQEVLRRDSGPRSIDVTTFEVDPTLAAYLQITLQKCELACKAAGIAFSSQVIQEDYIKHASAPLLTSLPAGRLYDCVILNPPYSKINSNSATRHALRSLGIETSNLYTAFVAVALSQLESGGQLVAITPRSFCNGAYFEPFRKLLLSEAAINRIHLYESRKHAFSDDDVLQENIVYHLTRSAPQAERIVLSSSHSPGDTSPQIREVPFTSVVRPQDPRKFIRLVVSTQDHALAATVHSLPMTLKQLGLNVSTGPVVDFRLKDHLRMEPGANTAPLIYPTHFDNGFINWPKVSTKKPNAIVNNEVTAKWLIARGFYVLTKRFSSKEERRRIVAAVYHPDRLDAPRVRLENHINYFHTAGEPLPQDLAKGLMLFLNSTAVDQYFRMFSGHTQVNATDLRNLHYPPRKRLVELGSLLDGVLPEQGTIDEMVGSVIGLRSSE